MAWPAVKLNLTQSEFADYLKNLTFGAWRPSLIVWHNTAAPSLADWNKTAAQDIAARRVPGFTRIRNLENYFKDQQHWSGGPHLFIAPDYIWVFNPLTVPGVHSPSWNHISIGIEMIGDFDKESADTGDGHKVKNNCIFATALLCETFGLSPEAAIKLHKQDPKTTHVCPGESMAQDKTLMVNAVLALMPGGEHLPEAAVSQQRSGVVNVDDLTVRTGPGVSNAKRDALKKGAPVTILDDAKNASTGWFKIGYGVADQFIGWVAARYITAAT